MRPSATGGGHVGARHVDERLPVGWSRGVQVDEMADTVGRAVRGAGDHHAAIAVPDENDAVQILEMEQFHDVFDVAIEIHTAAKEVLPFTKSGQRWGVHLVSLSAQQARYGLIAPAAVPAAMNQNICRHSSSPIFAAGRRP